MAQQALRWKHLHRVLQQFGEELVNEYIVNLHTRKANATYNLADSVSYKVESGYGWIAVDISLLEYWKYVEYGRKAGKFPPLQSIEEWIKVKGIKPMTRTQASVKRWTQHRGRIRRNDGGIPSIKSLAYLIGRKIKEEGIQPRPILTTSIDEVYSRLESAIDEAITQDITDSVDIIIAEIYEIE